MSLSAHRLPSPAVRRLSRPTARRGRRIIEESFRRLRMTASRSSLNLPESVVMRWALKAFLVGLFLGAIAVINAFGEAQPQRSAATLVLTEGLVYLDDRPVEPN